MKRMLGNVTRRMAMLILLMSAFFGPRAHATTYYLNARTGSDTNDGRTPRRAWRSLAKVSALTLAPGDQVVLAEGDTFPGSLQLSSEDAGTPDHPIVIRSGGKWRATIVSSDHAAISAAAGGIEIRDLVLQGNATAAKKGHDGITFYTENATGKRYAHVRLDNLEITGFGGAAIALGSGHESMSGYDDVRITRVTARANYGVGILSYDKVGDRAKGYAHHDVVVRDCDTSGNHGGSGIILSGIERGLVEFCRAAGNDGPGGGVGIWAYATRDVRFRYCIASGTRTRGKDGGGFDLDGACLDCMIEQCLAFENDGPGYMHCDYPTAGKTRGNQIRSSVSINDGRYQEKANAVGFGFVTWGSGLDDCHITNNLALVTKDSRHGPAGMLFVAYIEGSQAKEDMPHIRGCTATDNVVVVFGTGTAMVVSDLPKATPSDVRFIGNDYQVREKAMPLFVWSAERYPTLDAWRTATGQETRTGTPPLPRNRAALPNVPASAYTRLAPRDLPDFPWIKWLAKPAPTK